MTRLQMLENQVLKIVLCVLCTEHTMHRRVQLLRMPQYP